VKGPNATVSEREVSGETALLTGFLWIREGRVPRVLVGGCDELSRFSSQYLKAFDQLCPPEERPRPLDRSSRGTAPGEGAAFLVLSNETGAVGARAELTAVEVDADPAPPLRSDPSGAALARCVERALGAATGPVDLVICGANGHPPHDLAHARGLRPIPSGRGPPVTAPKSIFGEQFSSGVLSTVLGVRALRGGSVPAITGLENPVPEARDLLLVRARVDTSCIGPGQMEPACDACRVPGVGVAVAFRS
jgi:3-oxoacyl-(acyl-carrier-protein) synthase